MVVVNSNSYKRKRSSFGFVRNTTKTLVDVVADIYLKFK